MTNKPSPWDEMTLEVLYAAHNRVSTKDYYLQSKLAPAENGKSFYDRIRVLEKLILDGLVQIDDGDLNVSRKNIPDWLIDGLSNGIEIYWTMFECINPTTKVREKIDRQLLEEIGLEGEYAVINFLKEQLAPEQLYRLKHISLIDDTAGFDIQTPSLVNTENTCLIEVKTTSRSASEFIFYISRNEARIASLNKNWFLVGVLREHQKYIIIGNINYEQFSSYLPVNVNQRGQWESAKITIPINIFKPGLP